SVTLRLESLARAIAEAQTPDAHVEPCPRTARSLVLLVPPARLEALLAACRESCAEWRLELESLAVRRVRTDEETVLRLPGREYCEVGLGLAEGAKLGALGQLAGAVHALDVFRREPGAELADEPGLRPHPPALAERELAQRGSVLVFHEHLAAAVTAGAIGPEHLLQPPGVGLAVHEKLEQR